MSGLIAVRQSGPIGARKVETILLSQGAAFDLSGDIALNSAHRQGDGSDHSDVALNNGHRAIVAGNPHGTSAADVGLGNVTDDAQLKRSSNDFSTFAEKAAPVSADILLLEDSGAAGVKKRVEIGNLPGGGDSLAIASIIILTDPGQQSTSIFTIFSNQVRLSWLENTDWEHNIISSGISFGTADGKFTVADTRNYMISLSVTANNINNTLVYFEIFVNNILVKSMPTQVHSSVDPSNYSWQIPLALSAGDVVEARIDPKGIGSLSCLKGSIMSVYSI